MSILVIAEHHNGELKSSTLNTVGAAQQLDKDIHILVAGGTEELAQNVAKIDGVSLVLLSTEESLKHGLAENVADVIVSLVKERSYEFVLAPATSYGKNILPRASALLDVAQISDVVKIVSNDTFVRPIYAGNILATVQSTDSVKLMTIRTTAFDAISAESGNAEIGTINTAVNKSISAFVSEELTVSDRPELSSAKVIVSGGRALGSAENFKSVIEPLADKLQAAIGASRAAVDSGYVPNDYQVGQTGKVVAPELYIAVGISGAIQHIAGMKDSKIIVAINKDEDAPIFQIADYGLVADLFQAVPELTKALS